MSGRRCFFHICLFSATGFLLLCIPRFAPLRSSLRPALRQSALAGMAPIGRMLVWETLCGQPLSCAARQTHLTPIVTVTAAGRQPRKRPKRWKAGILKGMSPADYARERFGSPGNAFRGLIRTQNFHTIRFLPQVIAKHVKLM